MIVHQNVLDSIGNTPLVELTRFDTGRCRLFAKLENQNPAGSIKDRIGLSLIEAAERDGKVAPGGTLIAIPGSAWRWSRRRRAIG
jgi:cystathionine beta-synthase